MALDGFGAIRDEEVIVPVVPREESTIDCQLVMKCSVSGNTPSAPPPPLPQVKIKRNKTKHILVRETRSKTLKPSANTRSKSKDLNLSITLNFMDLY